MKKILFCSALVLALVGGFMMTQEASAKVKMNNTKLVLSVGESYTLKAKGAKKVTWKSNKKKIATVTKKGLLKAKAKGSAVITAKAGKKSAKCKVVIKEKSTDKMVYNNAVFTKELFQKITYVKSTLVSDKVLSKDGICKIFAILAAANLKELSSDTEPLEGGLILSVGLKDGKKTTIGAGAQVTYNGKRYTATPSVTDGISKLLKEYACK